MSHYDMQTVQRAAAGRWGDVLCALSPNLAPAVEKRGRHVPCPVHGGRDGFRVFKDFEETGGGICNTCGSFPSGFRLLQWSTGKSLSDVIDAVGDYVCPNQQRGPRAKLEFDGDRLCGTVEDFGEAPLYNKADKPLSYFVSLVNARGERGVFWGKSLREAIEDAGIEPGDDAVFTQTDETRPSDRYRRMVWHAERLDPDEVAEEETEAEEDKGPGPAVLSASAARIWDESLELDFSDPRQMPLKRYFERRGFGSITDATLKGMRSVRFHPELPYYDSEMNLVGRFPAMVCAVRRSDGGHVTCHRLYLSPDGRKAPVEEPKKMAMVADGMTVSGCAIPLARPRNGVVCVAEGIETALSVTEALGLPCWSCVSAGMMEKFVPPASVEVVLIFADKDASLTGQKAAETLKASLLEKGISARVFLPKRPIPEGEKGIDWNDILTSEGAAGFPNVRFKPGN